MKNIIRSEWRRLWYDPFTRKYSIAMPLIGLLSGTALVMSTPLTQARAFTDLSVHEVISVMMLGIDVISMMLIVFCGVKLSREFSSGSIRTSLITTPQRKKLMLAKAIVYLLYAMAAAAMTAVLAFSTGEILLVAHNMPMATLSDTATLRLVAGCMAMPLFYAGISLCFAYVFQSAGGTITASLVVLFLPALLGLISVEVRDGLLPLLPSSAIHNLAGIAEGAEVTSMTGAVTVVLAWLILWFCAGMRRFERTDL